VGTDILKGDNILQLLDELNDLALYYGGSDHKSRFLLVNLFSRWEALSI
jgi:hypothetical protein